MTDRQQLDVIHQALVNARAALERIAIDDMGPETHREVVNAKSNVTDALYTVNQLLGKQVDRDGRPE